MKRAVLGLLLAAVVVAAGCAGEPEGIVQAKRVIDDLAAREFGRASSRYRMYEEQVLAPAAAPAWRRGLDHGDATVREWSVDSLARIGLAEDAAALADRLGDSARDVRERAMEGLVGLDAELALQVFLERTRGDDPTQVALGARGLAELHAVSALPLLVQRFQDESLPDPIRASLTQPLAVLGDVDTVRVLVDVALASSADVSLRRVAAEAAISVPRAAEARQELERMLASDDDYVRELAREALAAL